MTESLRILILEDNPADAELVQFELQDAGLAFTSKIVMTGEEYVQAIQDYCPDLILSDYDLPIYNGALALAEARKRCPDTPFILVTGAVTEDRAIDILTQGAKDYVLKSRLQQRLAPAVKRALMEADEHLARKQAEEDLRKAHAELEVRVLERTKALEAEIEERKKAEEDRERLLRDVQAEKDRLAALINSIQDEVWFADKEKSITLVNPAVERIFGAGELEGRQVEKIVASYEVYRANGTPRTVEEAPPLRALRGEVIKDEEEIVRTPATGDFRHRQVSAAPVHDAAGAIIGSVSVVRDITEHKAAEKLLQESEARLQFALKAARMVVWDYDPVTKKINISKMANEVLALPPGQGLENSDQGYSLIHPDDVEGHRTLVTEAIQDSGSYISVYRQVRDGEVFWLEERGQAITDEMGKTVRLVGVTQNITTSKAAELELERARDILTEAQRIAHLGSFEYVAATRTTVWSEEEYQIYGLDPAGPSPSYDLMLEKSIYPDDAALLHDTFTKAMQSCTVYELEHRIVRPDGSVRWVYDRAHPYFDNQGNLLRYVGATLDITERKMADEALRASDEQFRVLIQNLQSAIALIDEHGTFRIVNNSFLRVFEIPQDATILNVNNRDWSQWQVFDEQGVLLEVDEHPVRKAALTHTAVKNQLVAVKSPSSPDLKWLLVSAEPILNKAGGIHRLICTYYDITQRKAAEEALQNTLQRFYHTMASMYSGFLLMTDEGRIEFVNQAFCDLYQLKEAPIDLIGLVSRDLLDRIKHSFPFPDEAAVRIQEILQRGRPVRNEEFAMKGERTAMRDFIPLNVNGKSCGRLWIHTDITDRKEVEETLRESERLLKETQAVARLGGWKANPISDFLTWTEGVYNLIEAPLEYKPSFAEGLKFFAPKYIPIIKKDLLRTIETNESFSEECEVITTSGKQFWVEVRGLASVREDETSYVVGTIQDISRRKQAEEALRENEERIRAITSNTPDHILMQDLDLRYQLVINPQLGLTEADMLGKTDYEILGHDDAERLTVIKRTVLETGNPFTLESSVRNSKGETEYFAGVYVPKFCRTGQVDGIIGYFRNITKRKQAEIELQERTKQLEDANRELESFSYSVSHDLRAPLRAIDGFARMILNKHGDKFDEDTRRKFDMIRNSAKTMGQLIDDLLALSRLGKEALSLSRLNLEELTRNVWEELKAKDLDRSVNLKISHLPLGMGDWSLMKQVLVNILLNAMKFTSVREFPLIEVGGYEEGSEVVYYIRDNGVGFDMQYHDNLFGVFKRLHSTAEYEGTGVGLAIVQRIINKHGGRVWAEGEVDKGATFYFSLPTCMQSGG